MPSNVPLRRLLLLLALVAGSAGADQAPFDRDAALSDGQAAVGRTVGDYRFRDDGRKPVRMHDLLGQPLVVSLIYTSCEHTCPMLTRHLAEVVDVAREALGEDSFRIATIGFDAAADTPARMRLFARERGIDAPGWSFLSTDAATVAALARDLGFVFRAAPQGFDHLAQTTILDGEGKVYRQVYGANFDPPALVEPLKELVFGRRASAATVSGWVSGVRLLCTVYDPASGRYRFDYSLFVGLGVGVLTLGSVAAFIIRAWRQS
ncbi:MAG: SCO family protein [Gammaproteobacteria bacterium]|nr:SCO family protein [Gammaproteobacteria bacterium]NIR83468.1 SCO family protein [Gammaproteobacteria bacterium]NIR91390.1 SCO family protein [Gammaproteobacteria bacterium]NIU04630.1 SCO family protein [Gammaproteobacteria bacterium]NIV51672.1 SCO family protein [Gammaproteobacteria bacterium]